MACRGVRTGRDQKRDGPIHTDDVSDSYMAHVVAAFEQSLSNMTSRLQHLTSTAEQKHLSWNLISNHDSELNELRTTIEKIKHESGQIQTYNPDVLYNPEGHRRHHSLSSDVYPTGLEPPQRMTRHMSSDSMSSINSLSSACSATSQQSSMTDSEMLKKKKKKNWLRSSLGKAFSRKGKNRNGSISDVEPDTGGYRVDLSLPSSPLLQVPHLINGPSLKGSHSSHAICDGESVSDLQNQLHEKDMKLTDIQLEALSSAHQLEQLRETMNRMKNEMHALKADNSRLQQLIHKAPSSGGADASSMESLEKRLSMGEASNIGTILEEMHVGT